MGAPDEPEFQKRVLLAALSLLEETDGPIIRDFPEEAPPAKSIYNSTACPVGFTANIGHDGNVDDITELLTAFGQEAEGLQNWFDIGLKKRGRTTTGTSKLSLNEIVELFSSFVREGAPKSSNHETPIELTLKFASEDLKAFYTEAFSAQPGGPSGHEVLAHWFWAETLAARVLGKVRERALLSKEKEMRLLGSLLLIPRNQLHKFSQNE